MTVRLALFNLDNLFSRAVALSLDSWSEGKPILDAFATVNTLIRKPEYSPEDKAEIVKAVKALGPKKSGESAYAVLRENRGRLLKWPSKGEPSVVVNGRDEWVGWFELKSEAATQKAASARRKAQAQRVRQIYDQRRASGVDLITVLGDFNDTPDSDPVSPLLKNGSDLVDIFAHPKYTGDGLPGTFGTGTASNKIDDILMSPALPAHVTGGGVWRKGVWAGTKGTIFPHYPEMTRPEHEASDHAAIYADFDL
jgi:hypothetical protein